MAARKTERERGEHRAAFAVGALLGAAGGAVWTLFNVPRSGAETRAQVVRAVETAVRGVRDAVVGVGEQARTTGERAADRVALAVDAVTGGADKTEPLPTLPNVSPTASSPAAVAGAEGTDVAAVSPTVGADGAVGLGDPAPLDAAGEGTGPGPEAEDRPPGGASTATA